MDNLDAVVVRYALLSYFSTGFLLCPILDTDVETQQDDKLFRWNQTWRKEMAEAVMVKLEELGVGAWLAQGDRVVRFDFWFG